VHHVAVRPRCRGREVPRQTVGVRLGWASIAPNATWVVLLSKKYLIVFFRITLGGRASALLAHSVLPSLGRVTGYKRGFLPASSGFLPPETEVPVLVRGESGVVAARAEAAWPYLLAMAGLFYEAGAMLPVSG